MQQLLRKCASLALIMLLGVLSFGAHAGAMSQASGHSMGGMGHGANASNCLNICTTAPLHKDEIINDTDKDEDDAPEPPFYIQFQASPLVALKSQHSVEARLADEREPPPNGLPAYIKLTVFRVCDLAITNFVTS